MLSRQLSDGGLEAEFPPPMEQRGVGQDVVHVTVEIGTAAKDGVVGYAAVEAVKRIVDAFKERHPGVEVDVESDEDA
jgi:ABC-type glycerol-3-phosphate transport system substrate-binding protein